MIRTVSASRSAAYLSGQAFAVRVESTKQREDSRLVSLVRIILCGRRLNLLQSVLCKSSWTEILSGDCRPERRAARSARHLLELQLNAEAGRGPIEHGSQLPSPVRAFASQHHTHARTTKAQTTTAVNMRDLRAGISKLLPRVFFPHLAAACMATMATE